MLDGSSIHVLPRSSRPPLLDLSTSSTLGHKNPRIHAPSLTDNGSVDHHSWQLLSELQKVFGDLSASRERIGLAPTADSGRAVAFCESNQCKPWNELIR